MAEPIPLFAQPDTDPIVAIEQHLVGALLQNAAKALPSLPRSFSTLHYKDEILRDIHEAVAEMGAGVLEVIARGIPGADAAYLSGLMVGCPTWTAAPQYAEAISDAYHRRGLLDIAANITAQAQSVTKDMPAEAIAQQALAALDAQISRTERHQPGRSLDTALDAALEHAQRASRGDLVAGRSTGMPTVDNAMGGLENSTFIILGARPGVGKTALAVQWAVNNARQCKLDGIGGVLGFSLEMSATQLARRVLAEAARVSVTDLKRGRIDGRVDRLVQARHQLAGLPLWIEDAGGQGLPAIRQKTRAAMRRFGKLALIWVDHIQIVAPEEVDRRQGATQAVGRVSNALRDLSKEFDCPVLCLSQLSRGLLQRDDKRPNLGDLRQAGDIEQDADVVMFLHREEMFLSKTEPAPTKGEKEEKHQARIEKWLADKQKVKGKAELLLEKVRDGAPTTLNLNFNAETTSFAEPMKQSSFGNIPSNLSDWDDRYLAGDMPPGGY